MSISPFLLLWTFRKAAQLSPARLSRLLRPSFSAYRTCTVHVQCTCCTSLITYLPTYLRYLDIHNENTYHIISYHKNLQYLSTYVLPTYTSYLSNSYRICIYHMHVHIRPINPILQYSTVQKNKKRTLRTLPFSSLTTIMHTSHLPLRNMSCIHLYRHGMHAQYYYCCSALLRFFNEGVRAEGGEVRLTATRSEMEV